MVDEINPFIFYNFKGQRNDLFLKKVCKQCKYVHRNGIGITRKVCGKVKEEKEE